MIAYRTVNGERVTIPHASPRMIATILERENTAQDIVSATWKELHTRYLTWNGKEDWPWLLDFVARIPNAGDCQCQLNFRRWLSPNPPPWTTDMFGWTVKAHNAVNKRLGRPTLTQEQARALWST